MNYDLLFSPAKIGDVTVKNRIIMEPMCLGFGQFDGRATDTMMDYYEERAKGGVGLIFTEITRVNDMTGASSFGQLGMITKLTLCAPWHSGYTVTAPN